MRGAARRRANKRAKARYPSARSIPRAPQSDGKLLGADRCHAKPAVKTVWGRRFQCLCRTSFPSPRFAAPLRFSLPALYAVSAADFTYNEKTNADLAKKLKIPVYFAVPKSTWAKLPDIKTTDKLVEFKHPDGIKAKGDVGLRLVVAKRSGLSARLGKSGLLQTGDIMLTFRSEWGGAGAYPNIQMGISHTGFAYVDKSGNLRNLDNPMDAEYVGPGNLTSSHYRTLNFLHIIRPRNLTDAQKANLLAWATKLNASAGKVYPSQISFNQDYNKPKFQPGRPLDFVKISARSRSARAIPPASRSTCTAPSSCGRFCPCATAIRRRTQKPSRAAAYRRA